MLKKIKMILGYLLYVTWGGICHIINVDIDGPSLEQLENYVQN